jgi:hypothetical protein
MRRRRDGQMFERRGAETGRCLNAEAQRRRGAEGYLNAETRRRRDAEDMLFFAPLVALHKLV